jgi:hypothetical protein
VEERAYAVREVEDVDVDRAVRVENDLPDVGWMEDQEVERAADLAVNSVRRHVERESDPEPEEAPLGEADVRPRPRRLDAPAAYADLRNLDPEREIERVPDDVKFLDLHVPVREELEVAVREAEVDVAGDLQVGPGPFQVWLVDGGGVVDGAAEDLLEGALADCDDEIRHRPGSWAHAHGQPHLDLVVFDRRVR